MRLMLLTLALAACGAEGPSMPGADGGADVATAALDAPYSDALGGRVCRPFDDGVDCDGNPANGCEVLVLTDPTNCGRCGHRCETGLICRVGTCL